MSKMRKSICFGSVIAPPEAAPPEAAAPAALAEPAPGGSPAPAVPKKGVKGPGKGPKGKSKGKGGPKGKGPGAEGGWGEVGHLQICRGWIRLIYAAEAGR